MKMQNKRPTSPGWYWYELKGSWSMQPVLVFDGGGELGLIYTLGAISPDCDDSNRDGLVLEDADKEAMWSDKPIQMPALLLSDGLEGNGQMKKKQTIQPAKQIVFQRADPEALDMFDPDTKRCTMNCGPHAQDPRTNKERKFLCDECTTLTPMPSNR